MHSLQRFAWSSSRQPCFLLLAWELESHAHEAVLWAHLQLHPRQTHPLLSMLLSHCSHEQHCPPGRFLLIVTGALILYLAGVTPVRQAIQRLLGLEQNQQPQGHQQANHGQHRGPGGHPGEGRPAPQAPRGAFGGMLSELHAFVASFFTSLLPGVAAGCT